MNDHPLKTALDVAAGTTTVATLMQWLPPVAALLTIIWTAIRIFEWLRSKRIQE